VQSAGLVPIFIAAYWTVLAGELLGDKAVYTVTSLAARFSPAAVYTGISAAFMGKMLVAVLVADLLRSLPASWTAVISGTAFAATAVFLWREHPSEGELAAPERRWRTNAVLISFAAIFFSEWADIGQITAAALAARYRAPLLIWSAATAALMTKGALALLLGLRLRRWLPFRALRAVAAAATLVFAISAFAQSLGH
jgi:Ca2+/H+ antiporter, TMEM165/GDT1 family